VAAKILLTLLVGIVAAAGPLNAEEEGFGGSFLTPFPHGDIYSVLAVGDDYAEGLVEGLTEAFFGDARLQVRPKRALINGLMRPDFAEKLVAFEEDLKREPVNVAVVMLGAWDRVSIRDADGKRVGVGTPAWRKEYAERGDRLMKALKRQNVSVYWVGLPAAARPDHSEDSQMMNEVIRERVYLNGMKYIDAYAGFADENGGYDAWGPDVTGKIVRLRYGDGVSFTPAGNRKLAHFVERELKRDLSQAKANRSIPLAGAEEEQAKINPDKAKLAEPAAAGGAKPGEGAQGGADGGAPAQAAHGAQQAAGAAGSEGEQKADNGKISLRTANAAGREEVVTLDILRPAISASVVALVTRRESADKPSQMGAVLLDQIAGGLTVMSSVTPAAGGSGQGAAPRMSAAQTPYYRVMFKGERLTPKRGRADDVSWPRTDKAAEAPAPKNAPPHETGSTAKTRADRQKP
jgi:hypothetical protein